MKAIRIASVVAGLLALVSLPAFYFYFFTDVSAQMAGFGVSTGGDADLHFSAAAVRFDAWIRSRGFRTLGPEQLSPGMKLEAGRSTWYGGRCGDGRPVTVRLVVFPKALGGSGIRSDVHYTFNGLRSSEPRAAAAAGVLAAEIARWWEEEQELHPWK